MGMAGNEMMFYEYLKLWEGGLIIPEAGNADLKLVAQQQKAMQKSLVIWTRFLLLFAGTKSRERNLQP